MFYERLASFKGETLKKHLKKQILKWQDILNTNYKNEGGHNLVDYSKGALIAYIELLDFIECEERDPEDCKKLLKKVM